MPTYNRRVFVPQAIKYFQRQDYANRELIIVDDGSTTVADLIPDDPRIRYVRLHQEFLLGAKRNLACGQAVGEIVIHWDDDDWMADWRISYQVSSLLTAKADICGLHRLFYYNPELNRSWQYTYPKKEIPLLAGGSLCYTKSYWKSNPFVEIALGEDTRFVWSDKPKRTLALDDNTFYVALTHRGNTSPRYTTGSRWHPYPVEKIRYLLGKDQRFYSKLVERDADKTRSERRAKKVHSAIPSRAPLVSCIMPTRNRGVFVGQSISYFLRQDYKNKELIIVDDGIEDVADLVPSDAPITYIGLDERATVGHKRNLAVQNSKGEIIAHWDDDDWYADDRLSYQAQTLLNCDAEICGLDTGFFYDMRQNRFWSCTPALHKKMFFADVHGRSILYFKKLWERYGHYPDVSLGEDAFLLKKALEKKAKIVKVENDGKLIYIRHTTNAWQFDCGQFLHPSEWRGIDAPAFVSPEDLLFYKEYREGQTSRVCSDTSVTSAGSPLVSCIMPTNNRRHFVPQAIRYFLRQDYPNRELIIVDDGTDPVSDIVPDDSRIRYIRLRRKAEIGEKRNLACEKSEGEIIILWDDDDWYADHRISLQVRPLVEGEADLTGFSYCTLFCLPTHAFWACTDQLDEKMFFEGVVGGTLAFRKRFWQQGLRFPNASLGEDAQLLKRLLNKGARLEKLRNDGVFVYVRHQGNSWKFAEGEYLLRRGWRTVTAPSFVPAEDLLFYKDIENLPN
jgi:glycosyltransferase involved in cell wall biosynthesis